MEEDRLSKLHESELLGILSLIPFETAIVTSCLAKNCRAWTKLTNFAFQFNRLNPCFFHGEHTISQVTCVHSFCLDFAPTSDLLTHPLGCQTLLSWINAVCLREEVREIQVTVGCPLLPDPSLVLSSETIRCSSLQVLSLKGPFQFELVNLNTVNLPVLRVLQLHVYSAPTELITHLVNSCVLLEELTLGALFITGQSLVSWINTLCLREKVKRIQVAFGCRLEPNPSILLPSSVIRCSSLQVLSLKGPFQFEFEYMNAVNLPVLRVLHLHVYALQSELIARVLASCLLLEDLTVSAHHSIMGENSLHISTLSLNKLSLSIRTNNPGGNFVVGCSKLEHLTLYSPSLSLFHFANMSTGAMRTANIFSDYDHQITGDDDDDSFTNLALNVQCVLTLHLNSATLLKFNSLSPDSYYFENLIELKIKLDVNQNLSWNDLVNFLRFTPKLEVLTVDVYTLGMKWVAPQYPPPCGLDSVKRVEMIRFRGDPHDLSMIKYILKNASALEFLSVQVLLGIANSFEPVDLDEIQLCSDLFNTKRKSSTCQIDFCSKFLKASSKDFFNRIPCCDFIRLGDGLGIKGDFELKDDSSMLRMESRVPTHKKLSGVSGCTWNDVLNALDSPQLEALLVNVNTYPVHSHSSMKWVEPDHDPPFGFAPLKWIRITGFDGTDDDVKMVAYILRKAPKLELLSLDANRCYDDYNSDIIWSDHESGYDYEREFSTDFLPREEYSLCDQLFSLPRSSLICEVKFSGKLLTASSNGFQGNVPYVEIIQLGNLHSNKGLQALRYVNGAVEAEPSNRCYESSSDEAEPSNRRYESSNDELESSSAESDDEESTL